MTNSAQFEVFQACLAPSVYEKGGGYGQKGVDFQRYWAISRIVELAHSNQPDFLILFESLQDIVEFDHPSTPTAAKVYQLKMKDSGEWTWKALTALPSVARKKRNSDEKTVPLLFEMSPIGKLARTLSELTTLQREGVFVSNLGCSAELEKGSTAGSLRVCKFSELTQELRDQIGPELQKLKNPVPIESLHIHRTELSLEDPDTHVTGKLNNYLSVVAPKHTGQARSFADSLFATLSKRGRRTDPPADFADLVATRGYSRSDFMNAVEVLRGTPDQQALVDTWLAYLKDEQMPILELTRLQVRLIQLFEKHLQLGEEKSTPLAEAAKQWVALNPPDKSTLTFVRNGGAALLEQFPAITIDQLQAQIVLEGINQCLSQT
jgi:Cap4 dsDNA endonuclease